MKLCSVGGCEKPSRIHGMCRMHDTRVQRHGSPHIRLPNGVPVPIEEVLSTRIPSRPVGACWEWEGHRDKRGYGRVNLASVGPRFAHRVAYEHFTGASLTPDEILMHSCDNPPCCNPAHLTPGTHQQNVADMVRKGRNARGEKHRAAKLTAEQVMEIRRKYATGNYTLDQLCAEYGITPTPMSQAIRGITWKHLPLIAKGVAA